jgi:SNF2 family DNA or RNA helicase
VDYEKLRAGVVESTEPSTKKHGKTTRDLPTSKSYIESSSPPALWYAVAAFAATGLTYESDVGQLTKARIEFEQWAKARRKVAEAKIPFIIEHVKRVLESQPKVLVFAHHIEVISQLSDAFTDAEHVVYYGGTPEKQRAANVERFQKDPECKVFIGGLQAAGVGLTLTAASLVVFAEIDGKDPRQAEDRVHRIGQVNPVLIQTLVFDWSVDANLARMMIAKVELSEKVLDGKGQ